MPLKIEDAYRHSRSRMAYPLTSLPMVSGSVIRSRILAGRRNKAMRDMAFSLARVSEFSKGPVMSGSPIRHLVNQSA